MYIYLNKPKKETNQTKFHIIASLPPLWYHICIVVHVLWFGTNLSTLVCPCYGRKPAIISGFLSFPEFRYKIIELLFTNGIKTREWAIMRGLLHYQIGLMAFIYLKHFSLFKSTLILISHVVVWLVYSWIYKVGLGFLQSFRDFVQDLAVLTDEHITILKSSFFLTCLEFLIGWSEGLSELEAIVFIYDYLNQHSTLNLIMESFFFYLFFLDFPHWFHI